MHIFASVPVRIALTATLCDGVQVDIVCRFFGLTNGHYHLIRRSNARYDVQWLLRTAQSGPKGRSFPELDWTIR
ncbi:hypothetical protein FOMPIDRAFT_52408 [Fomitopsis schrenkii]|uniref:Uncharacterized protein n=1 Tax=Fomitopsis schrenkii TaxID=2126942 RepID=S8EAQ9_FOMSC|nr:hypothetical protein FOMPIDRAFT_52408 [Fomitopsis schrenkii]